jgi:hypothetical protein
LATRQREGDGGARPLLLNQLTHRRFPAVDYRASRIISTEYRFVMIVAREPRTRRNGITVTHLA